MKTNFWNNFFRKDLNLKSHWWHRLLSIVFIFSFIIFVAYNLITYSVSDMFRGDVGIQKWNKADGLSERINSEIKPVSAFIKPGEKIGENDRTYVLNDQPDAYYKGVLNDVYCSTELSEKFGIIKSSRNIDSLYIRNLYKRENVSPEIFSKFIEQNDIKCLMVDAYSDTNGGRVTFLEPDRSYQDNWSFFEKSSIKTMVYFLEMIPIILGFSFMVFAGILVIYYKIFLYIVFGSRKENN